MMRRATSECSKSASFSDEDETTSVTTAAAATTGGFVLDTHHKNTFLNTTSPSKYVELRRKLSETLTHRRQRSISYVASSPHHNKFDRMVFGWLAMFTFLFVVCTFRYHLPSNSGEMNNPTEYFKKTSAQIELNLAIAQLNSNTEKLISLLTTKEHELNSKDSTRSTDSLHSKSPKNLAIFYNTYQNSNDTAQAHSIMSFQLKTLNRSPLANTTIYYSRFGDQTAWPILQCLNNGMRECEQITAKEEGDEIETVQYLYEYCQKNTNDRVVYMHSKGSYTKSWTNRILNKLLLKAITSTECLFEMGKNDKDCNTCSTQFNGFPAHYPGNMWVADCDYITHLIPPIEFEPRKAALAKKMQSFIKKFDPDNDLDDRYLLELDNGNTLSFHNASRWQLYRESWLGYKRYAMEHWLGSHPDMKPCDVFSPKNGIPQFSYDDMRKKRVFADSVISKIEMAPAVNFNEFWSHPYRLHPWYRLAGILYSYKELYHKEPPRSSWAHRFLEGTNFLK